MNFFFIFYIKKNMERLNKEYCLDFNNKLNLKYGTVNKNFPQVVYISGNGWIAPKFNGEYDALINCAINKFKSQLKHVIISSPFFENKFVCDFDIKTASLRENKKNYFMFEFYVKQKDHVVQLKDLKTNIKNTFKFLIDNLVNNLTDNTFELTRNK